MHRYLSQLYTQEVSYVLLTRLNASTLLIVLFAALLASLSRDLMEPAAAHHGMEALNAGRR